MSAIRGTDKTTDLPRLTESSLFISGAERLAEASCNPYYALADLEFGATPDENLKWHWSVTPVHEAGHAVAMVLAGREVGTLSFKPWGGRKTLGRVTALNPIHGESAFAERLGPVGVAREIVTCFAGPAAELRCDPRRMFSGSRQDFRDAEGISKLYAFEGFGDSFEVHSAAWMEACRMMADDRVFASVTTLANRLNKSYASLPRVAGGAVRSVVRKALPQGWDWRPPFALR